MENYLAYDPVRFSTKMLLKVFGGLRIEGQENVPASGPAIIASNHLSHLDPPGIAGACPRYIFFMAKEELFEPRLLGWYLRQIGTFPVKRGAADRTALKRAFDILATGHVLGMFPEGHRSDDGRLQPPEEGVGLIALRSRAPVVPTALTGTGRVLRPGSVGLHFSPVKMRFGKPITFDDLYDQRGREAVAEASRRIMAAIAEMLPPDYLPVPEPAVAVATPDQPT